MWYGTLNEQHKIKSLFIIIIILTPIGWWGSIKPNTVALPLFSPVTCLLANTSGTPTYDPPSSWSGPRRVQCWVTSLVGEAEKAAQNSPGLPCSVSVTCWRVDGRCLISAEWSCSQRGFNALMSRLRTSGAATRNESMSIITIRFLFVFTYKWLI